MNTDKTKDGVWMRGDENYLNQGIACTGWKPVSQEESLGMGMNREKSFWDAR